MATRITANGQLTVPKPMREALQLAPGDLVEFQLNGNGEVVLRRSAVQRRRTEQTQLDEQMQRRAEELTALLRGLD